MRRHVVNQDVVSRRVVSRRVRVRDVITGDVRARDERGSATAWSVPFVGVLALLTVLMAGVGGALITVRRVQAAADLAALAGATAYAGGRAACVEATRVADRNGGQVDSCTVLEDGDVRVVVSASVGGPWPKPLTVRGRARAGPAG